MFSTSTKDKLTDSHLWISVVFRPQQSHFTRAQRLTCCFASLFMTMIASAMFYGTDAAVEQPQLVSIGPFRISLYELWVSVLSILIVVPVDVLIVTIFRKIRPPMDYDEVLSLVTNKSILTFPPISVLKEIRMNRHGTHMTENIDTSRDSILIDTALDNTLKPMFGSQNVDDMSEEDMEEMESILENEYMELLENESFFKEIDAGILNELNDLLMRETTQISMKQDGILLNISKKKEISFLVDKPMPTEISMSTDDKDTIDRIDMFKEQNDDIIKDVDDGMADEMYQIMSNELQDQPTLLPGKDTPITQTTEISQIGTDTICKDDMTMFEELNDNMTDDMYQMLGNELSNQVTPNELQCLSTHLTDSCKQYLETPQKHLQNDNVGDHEYKIKQNDKNPRNYTCCCSRQQTEDIDIYDQFRSGTFLTINRITSTLPDIPNTEHEKKSTKGLPRGCLIVGWILAVLTIISPSFFLILYSMDWGKEKSNSWLVSFVMALLETLFLTDPTKVNGICTAYFQASFHQNMFT